MRGVRPGQGGRRGAEVGTRLKSSGLSAGPRPAPGAGPAYRPAPASTGQHSTAVPWPGARCLPAFLDQSLRTPIAHRPINAVKPGQAQPISGHANTSQQGTQGPASLQPSAFDRARINSFLIPSRYVARTVLVQLFKLRTAIVNANSNHTHNCVCRYSCVSVWARGGHARPPRVCVGVSAKETHTETQRDTHGHTRRHTSA